MEEVTQIHADAHRKALEDIKADLDREISNFKGEVLDLLRDVSSLYHVLLSVDNLYANFNEIFRSFLKMSKRFSAKRV